MPALRPVPAPPRLPELSPGTSVEDAYQMAFTGDDFSGLSVDDAEIEQSTFAKVSFARVAFGRTTLVDAELAHCDLANAVFERGGWRRVVVSDSRLTGLTFIDGMVRDVVFRESKVDLTNWRASTFTTVRFDRCDLTRADFAGADLRGATFTECQLMAAQFSGAKMSGARFVNCDLTGIGGIESLAGSAIQAVDLMALTELMAGALGISLIKDGEA